MREVEAGAELRPTPKWLSCLWASERIETEQVEMPVAAAVERRGEEVAELRPSCTLPSMAAASEPHTPLGGAEGDSPFAPTGECVARDPLPSQPDGSLGAITFMGQVPSGRVQKVEDGSRPFVGPHLPLPLSPNDNTLKKRPFGYLAYVS